MKTLMHICCAPCANQPIEVLRTDGFEVTGFWYNPNIHPVTEYRARRNCLQAYAEEIELPLILRNDYGLRPFVRAVVEDIPGRCVKCYAALYAGGDFLLAAEHDGDSLTGMELLGNAAAAPGILGTLGFSRGHFRTPGTALPGAMFRPLRPGADAPGYFGLIFD